MYSKIEPVIDYAVRGLCRKPYHNHPKGCPNWGKDKCPPGLPKLENYFDITQPLYIIWNKFDIGEHIEKMRKNHPDWTDYQLRCVLYWQGTARKQLKNEIKKFIKDHPECDVTTGPEAMGVNVTETMKKAGIELEWPPMKYSYQIAMGGTKKDEKIIQSFEKFTNEGIRWYNKGKLGEIEKDNWEEPPQNNPIGFNISGSPKKGEYFYKGLLIRVNKAFAEDFYHYNIYRFNPKMKRVRDGMKYYATPEEALEKAKSYIDEFGYRIEQKHPGNLTEEVRWYNKGKLGPDEKIDVADTTFKIGDRATMPKKLMGQFHGAYWNDNTDSSINTSLKNPGKWTPYNCDSKWVIDKIDFVENLDGYTGVMLHFVDVWPWFQETGFIKA